LLAMARELLDEYHEDLRARVRDGLDQLKRGESTEYTEETLHELFDDIDRRGREWLKSRNTPPADGPLGRRAPGEG